MMVTMMRMMMTMTMKGNKRVAEQIECGRLERPLHKLTRLFVIIMMMTMMMIVTMMRRRMMTMMMAMITI